MSEARPWLPPDTCFGTVDRKVERIVRAWSRTWFGDERANIASGVPLDDAASRGTKRRACASGAWLLVPDGTTAAIARGALHLDAGAPFTDADRQVLEDVGEGCLAALSDTLVRELGLAEGGRADTPDGTPAFLAGRFWAIDIKHMRVRLGFAMREADRIDLLLRLLPLARPKAGLGSCEPALARLEVEVAAHLGTCGITLAELKTLSAGDVLVLEHDLSAALPLAIDGASARTGSCKVARDADNLLLEISEPIIGTVK